MKKKWRDLTQSYDKGPYTHRKIFMKQFWVHVAIETVYQHMKFYLFMFYLQLLMDSIKSTGYYFRKFMMTFWLLLLTKCATESYFQLQQAFDKVHLYWVK